MAESPLPDIGRSYSTPAVAAVALESVDGCRPPPQSEPERRRRLSWSQLLARVFAIDVLRCDRCGSRMQQVEWVSQPSRIRTLLEATGPPGSSAASPASAPPTPLVAA